MYHSSMSTTESVTELRLVGVDSVRAWYDGCPRGRIERPHAVQELVRSCAAMRTDALVQSLVQQPRLRAAGTVRQGNIPMNSNPRHLVICDMTVFLDGYASGPEHLGSQAPVVPIRTARQNATRTNASVREANGCTSGLLERRFYESQVIATPCSSSR